MGNKKINNTETLILIITIHPNPVKDSIILKRFGIDCDNTCGDGYHIFNDVDIAINYLKKHGVDMDIMDKECLENGVFNGRYLDLVVEIIKLNSLED